MKRFSQIVKVTLALLVGVFSNGLLPAAQASAYSMTNPDGEYKKVYVCKYVGTPGVNEQLQTGNNPISVSTNAIQDFQGLGSYFNDAQGRSYAVAWDNGDHQEPPLSMCPAPSPILVTPDTPVVNDSCGTANDAVVLPTSTGITYTKNQSGLVATIVATPQAGYILQAGNGYSINADGTATLVITLSNLACPPEPTHIAPLTPLVMTKCGPNNDMVNLPTQTGATFTASAWTDNSLTVTATPQVGYVLDGQTTWTFTDTAAACPTIKPCTVMTGPELVNQDTQFADSQDTRTAGHYEFVANGLHIWTDDTSSQAKVAWYHAVDYSLDSVGAPSMSYTANNGVEPGLQLVIDFNNDGTADGILVGESVYGNNWWLSNSAATFVKTNAPHNGSGYGSTWYGTLDEWLASFSSARVKAVGFSLGSGVLADGILQSITFGCHTWTFGLKNAEVPAPAFFDYCGELSEDYVYIPQTEGVAYTVNGSQVESGYHVVDSLNVVIVATVAPGYMLASEAQTSWSYSFTNTACLEIRKEAMQLTDTNHDGIIGVGDTATWKITVMNTASNDENNNVYEAFNLQIADLDAVLENDGYIESLSPGESITLYAHSLVTTAHVGVSRCSLTNTATFSAVLNYGERDMEFANDDLPFLTGSSTANLDFTCPTPGSGGHIDGKAATTQGTTIPATGPSSSPSPLLTIFASIVAYGATLFVQKRREIARHN